MNFAANVGGITGAAGSAVTPVVLVEIAESSKIITTGIVES